MADYIKEQNRFHNDRLIIILIVFFAIAGIGLVTINLITEQFLNGIRDLNTLQYIWSKDQETAVMDLDDFIQKGDYQNYFVFEKQINDLIQKHRALITLENNGRFFSITLSTKPFFKDNPRLLENLQFIHRYINGKPFSQLLPVTTQYNETLLLRGKLISKLTELKKTGQNFHSTYQNNSIVAPPIVQSYLYRIQKIDFAISDLQNIMTRKLMLATFQLQNIIWWNHIALGLLLTIISILILLRIYKSINQWKENLLQSVEKLRLVFNNALDGILLIHPDGKIVAGNEAASQILHTTPDQLVKHKVTDFINFYDTETQAMFRQFSKNKKFSGDLRVKRNDDQFIAGVSVSTAPGKNKQNLACVILRDRTPEIEYLNKVKQSEQNFRNLLNGIDEGIYILNKDGILLAINTAAVNMFGYREEEILGYRPGKFSANHMIDKFKNSNYLQEVLKGNPQTFEWWGEKKDGNVFPLEISIVKGSYNNQPVGIAVARDITDRHQRIQKLTEAYNEKLVLLQEIHHRVKNNMALVTGLLQLQVFSTSNEEVQNILNMSQNRIHTIAQIHEILYKSNSFSEINFDEYLQKLIDESQYIFKPRSNIELLKHLEAVSLNINQAIPCALLINEILIQIVEQVSENNKPGKIHIFVNKKEEKLFVKISSQSDQRTIMNHSINYSNSLGESLIETLTQQLEAQFSCAREKGTDYSFSFAIKNERGTGNSWLN